MLAERRHLPLLCADPEHLSDDGEAITVNVEVAYSSGRHPLLKLSRVAASS
jgi:hypothetical protein